MSSHLSSPMPRVRSPVASPASWNPLNDQSTLESRMTHDVSEIVDIIHDSEAKKFRLGVLLILVAVVSWVIGLELVNAVLKDGSYQKPLLFTYISGGCFALNLVPDIIRVFNRTPVPEPVEKDEDDPVPLTRVEFVVLSVQVAVIYFLYNACVLSCLKYTSASNQTVLASTTSIFTLLIGCFLRIDSFSVSKVVCTAVSFLGVLLVNFSESKGEASDGDNKFVPKNPKLGNTLAIAGALMYAFYLIIMKVKVGTGNRCTNERQLFGLVGVATLVLGAPVLYVADIYGYETFEFPPPNAITLLSIFINGVFSYISDFSTILASLLTSPLITSLSLTSCVPVTIFIDYMVLYFTGGSGSTTSTSRQVMYVTGILSILTSVVLINLTTTTENEFIENVIGESLEEGIKNDEILSPMLSPLLTARPHTLSNFSSPLLPMRRETTKKVSHLNLEGEGLINKNHNATLYTVDSRLEDDENERSNIVIYGGNNHIYHIKHVDSGSG
ncbi:hypothetical protein PSN45_004755 [Yamadazyma tenuis]|uniref:EamA domain-containing protein n=1 Tax=Candida tenuis (strain ATCC 10573 / BCRC 21748 / CBS 615 / JCM 9827 / NBRC 10315 / NRRL Y-1498 / VKM Y-70) TaxID=590646 RepID=G3B6N1_CANTC|nr:uncharacterized protein CANTEDRAFT_114293 [Yamadazyma tenuis ATCC 10573]EGV62976.1 hypothetical protein CANTEDRAFT_114293 [Yamadazyma tenuis ATCC 10573]WEJ97207.1 hypothetical protein PSN45_004755 [Yamadazyma tenuis]